MLMTDPLCRMCAGLHTSVEVDAYAEAHASASALLGLAAILDAQCRHADATTLLKAIEIAAPALPGLQARLALSLSAAGEHTAARERFEAVLGGDVSAGASGVDNPPVASRLQLAYSRTLLALDRRNKRWRKRKMQSRAMPTTPAPTPRAATHWRRCAGRRTRSQPISARPCSNRLWQWEHYGIGKTFMELGRAMAALQGLSRALELSERTQQDADAAAQTRTPPAPLSYPCLPVHALPTSAICESIGLAWAKAVNPRKHCPGSTRAGTRAEPSDGSAVIWVTRWR